MYLPDKELHSNILKENSVPNNVDQVKKLDDFPIHELITQGKVLEKIQVKIRDTMGPFVDSGTLLRKPPTLINCR